MLGPRAGLEPGDEGGFELGVGRLGPLASQLGQAHRLAEGAEIQRGAESGGNDLRVVVVHAAIVGRGPCAEKVYVGYSTAP